VAKSNVKTVKQEIRSCDKHIESSLHTGQHNGNYGCIFSYVLFRSKNINKVI